MDKKPQNPESPGNLFVQDAGLGIPESSDRDMACLILADLDCEAQLIAISDLLRQQDDADARTAAQIEEVEEFARKSTGLRNQRAVDEWIDLLHGSTYQNAGHSMAAVGMLAPLIESLFYQAFQGIRVRYYGADAIPPERLRSGMTKADHFWDCHRIYNPKAKTKYGTNLLLGIMELATSIELLPHLPSDSKSILEALFQYRNKMFHCGGFEWPAGECASFAKDIAEKNWQTWFSSATRDGVPFIFYMTNGLIGRSFDLVHKLLEGFGAYCRGKVPIVEIPTERVSWAKRTSKGGRRRRLMASEGPGGAPHGPRCTRPADRAPSGFDTHHAHNVH